MSRQKYTFQRPPAAPVYRPSLKEFEDPLAYVEKIRPVAQKFGICKIIAPKQWNPPFVVDYHTFKFRPRVQRLNEVGAHSRVRNNFLRCLEAYWEFKNCPLQMPVIRNERLDLFDLHKKVKDYGGAHQVSKNKQWTQICRDMGFGEKSKYICSNVRSHYDKLIKPYLDFCDDMFVKSNPKLFCDVKPRKGRGKTGLTLESPKITRSKSQASGKAVDGPSCKLCESEGNVKELVICSECDLKYHIGCLKPPLSDVPPRSENWICSRCSHINCQKELAMLDSEVFGFSQSTCKYSLATFAAYADSFKSTYFNNRKVSLKEVEEEYWRLVSAEDESEDVIVKYGADISSGQTSSGFPTSNNRHLFPEKDQQYIDSGWNLNNLPILSKSIFRFISNDISGMTVPWCYVGMVFSCFCWHIEDHWSYSINYMHMGDAKTWYGIPESDADKFENLMRQEAKELFDQSPDLLHHITTQLNPTVLLKHDVKVFRTDQAAGEFVITFPRAYHAGFNQGFNFAEAVNFCPADWLIKGRLSVASYRQVKRPSVFSHNELICKMASTIESLDLLLLKAVYEEVLVIQQEEKASRKQLCLIVQGTCRTERLQLDKISEDDRECLVCRTTLYISGVTCTVCCTGKIANRMTCLDHIKDICHCSTMENIVLKYRYSLDEITSLVANVNKQLEHYKLWMTRVYHLAKSEFCSSPISSEEGRVMKNIATFIENLEIVKDEDVTTVNVEEKPNLEELKMLLQHGKCMNCPSYLLDFLEAIIDTCHRAMDMTDKLLHSHKVTVKDEKKELSESIKSEVKCKSYTDIKLGAIAKKHEEQADKLTLSEMRLLVEKLRSLPAHVPQLEEAADILNSINEWRKKVKTVVLSQSVTNNKTLLSLIETGESNLVYLSEYHMLHKMVSYACWITDAQLLINWKDKEDLPKLEQFMRVRDEGKGLINTVEIDRIATLTELLELEDEDDLTSRTEATSDYRRTGWTILIDQLSNTEGQLSKVISDGESMQKKADEILKSTPGVFALFALTSLLKSAEAELKCTVIGIEKLKDVVKEAVIINDNIMEMWQKLQQGRRLVHVDDLQTLIKQAESLCVSFDHLSDLRTLYRTIDAWRKNLNSLFIKNHHISGLTTCALLEVLFPRPTRQFKLMIARESSTSSKLVASCKAESMLKTFEDNSPLKEEPDSPEDMEEQQQPAAKSLRNSNSRSSRKNRGRQRRGSVAADDPQSARLDNVSTFEAHLKAVAMAGTGDVEFHTNYKNMCVSELEWMWSLRELNEEKANKDSSGHDVYCFCRKRGIDQKGAQVMCDLCQDWFHLACLGIQNKDMSKKKFLCPQCERSKRPPFEVILAEKRKLEQEAKMIVIPEHIGLCLMCQRVINFHKHTNQLFSPQTELGAAFAEYKKLFGVHAILPKYHHQTSSASSIYMSGGQLLDHHHSPLHDQGLSDGGGSGGQHSKQSRKTPHGMGKLLMPLPQTTQIQQQQQQPTPPPPTPVQQQSPVPSKETLISINRLRGSLSEEARRELEEIYIELCLLEVNQPTVTWIWKLYHSLIVVEDTDQEIATAVAATGGASGSLGGGDNDSLMRSGDPLDVAGVVSDDLNSNLSDGDPYENPVTKLDCMRRLITNQRKSIERSHQRELRRHRSSSSTEQDRPKQDSSSLAAAVGKFSFKRKLVAKGLPLHTAIVKKHTTGAVRSSGSGGTPKKRGRCGTGVAKSSWDCPPSKKLTSSEYYDEENDMILLDTFVERTQDARAAATAVRKRITKATGGNGSSKGIFGSGGHDEQKIVPSFCRQPRQIVGTRCQNVSAMSDRAEDSDENVPSPKSSSEPKVSSKRGRKPATSSSNAKESSLSSSKRRKRGGRSSRRVCNDDCAAEVCVQQSSEKVNWVACDMCDLWFHWHCIGIKSESEIEQKFLCFRCRDTKRQKRLPSFRDVNYIETKTHERNRDRLISSDTVDDLDGDDLNVSMEEDLPFKRSSTSRLLDRKHHQQHSTTFCESAGLPDNLQSPPSSSEHTTFTTQGLSPPPPFLHPETDCCVQEEVVEISYASRSDSES